MSYLFGTGGEFAGYARDNNDRVYVLEGLRQCLTSEAVREVVGRSQGGLVGGHKVLLTIPEPRLREIAATVHSEVGVGHDKTEAEGIARVIRNRAAHKAVALDSTNLFKDVGGGGMYGRKAATYTSANARPIEQWIGTLRSDLEGAVKALVNPTDVTGGAYFWDGTQGILNNANHPWRKEQVIGGTDPHYKGTALEGTYTPVWLWKSDLGETSFFSYNPAGSHPKNVWP
jgi:hypothetical protein